MLSFVRPLAGAGIEIKTGGLLSFTVLFAPSRGRELKLVKSYHCRHCFQFAPSRGRELKYVCLIWPISNLHVRPLAGAGIEIEIEVEMPSSFERFAPSRGRELK